MTDWKSCSVVRDGKGRLRTDDGPIRGLVGDGLVSAESAAAYEHMLGPLVPILDAEGLPVVRTVGDLTARHIGRRVRVEFDRIPALHELDGQLSRMLVNSNGVDAKIGGAWYALRADTPCEVLDLGEEVEQPCLWCRTSTCAPSRMGGRTASHRRPRRHRNVVEDVEWLLYCGETHPETIAYRLGYLHLDSLYAILRRAERGDLIKRMHR